MKEEAQNPPRDKRRISYEVIERDGSGQCTIETFSDEFATAGAEIGSVLRKMQMLQELGLSEARKHLKDDNGKRLVVKKDDLIWLLKCKPSCWRLYFYVTENSSEIRIIYVWAVCKKQDEEDPKDAKRARRIADTIRRPGGSCIRAIEFPLR